MEVVFADNKYEQLETDPREDGGFPQSVVASYRKRIQFLRSAKDERDIYAWKSLHYEKLKGARENERSIKLNDQWRLVFEIRRKQSDKIIFIKKIEDYH